jgi:hypothetical protein
MSTKFVTMKAPSFSEVDTSDGLDKIEKEIRKVKPKIEVSIEGHSEIAKGNITEWNSVRKLFTVTWDKRSETFHDITGAKTGLRAFFKCHLFSTQLVFKTTTVRRLEDGNYHYRMPTQVYQQQSRGALRVPIHSGNAVLNCKEGRFKIVDLSTTGARLRTSKKMELSKLTDCELNLAGKRLSAPEFSAHITTSNDGEMGVRFVQTNESMKTEIKQFLIDALKVHYEKEW